MIEGTFFEGAYVTWDVLLCHQEQQELSGDLFEIGVLKGKSAALLALHVKRGESLALVDPAMRLEATDAVKRAGAADYVLFRMRSDEIAANPGLDAFERRCRWVHIDGLHTGPAVRNDLDIAARILSPRGIICLDDFFTPAYPQITRSAFNWLAAQQEEFALFLIGFNKGYICRAEAAPSLLEFVRDRLFEELARRDFANVTIWKTTEPLDMNCFGVTPQQRHARFKGPDWAPDTLPL